MIVTYSPEDGPQQRWEFAPRKIKSRQAEEIERRYGAGFGTWVTHLREGVASARRVLLWHLMRRDHPTLRWDDVPDFGWGELEVELSRDELTAVRERAAADTSLDPEVREAALEALDKQIAEAPALDDEPEGKATASSAG